MNQPYYNVDSKLLTFALYYRTKNKRSNGGGVPPTRLFSSLRKKRLASRCAPFYGHCIVNRNYEHARDNAMQKRVPAVSRVFYETCRGCTALNGPII